MGFIEEARMFLKKFFKNPVKVGVYAYILYRYLQMEDKKEAYGTKMAEDITIIKHTGHKDVIFDGVTGYYSIILDGFEIKSSKNLNDLMKESWKEKLNKMK